MRVTPRRFELSLGPGQFVSDRPVKRNSVLVVSDCLFERVSGRDVLTGFTLTQSYETETLRTICDFSGMRFYDDQDQGEFGVGEQIPDGTRVQVHEEPQIQYVWYDGDVVKKIDFDLALLEGHAFFGSTWARVLVLLACVAALVAIALFFVHRRRSIVASR